MNLQSTRKKGEVKELEKLIASVASLASEIVKTGDGVELYQTALQNLQGRYHILTGRYYHFVREELV